MRSIRNGLVTGLVAFAVFGAATAVLGQASFHQDRPFFATSEGTSQLTGMPAPGVFTSASAGTVTGTHIGSGTYELAATQDYPRHTESGTDNVAGNCAFVDGTITIQAANGDQIDGDLDADRSVSCVSQETPGPGVDAQYLSTLYIEVVGGTGRFDDASGWLFSRGTSTADNPPTGPTFTDAGIIVGDIDY